MLDIQTELFENTIIKRNNCEYIKSYDCFANQVCYINVNFVILLEQPGKHAGNLHNFVCLLIVCWVTKKQMCNLIISGI